MIKIIEIGFHNCIPTTFGQKYMKYGNGWNLKPNNVDLTAPLTYNKMILLHITCQSYTDG